MCIRLCISAGEHRRACIIITEFRNISGRKTLAGIYRHKILNRKIPLVRSMDDYVMAPHSRYTEVRRKDIEKHPELIIAAESQEAGIFLVLNDTGSQIFVQGHPEYDRMTLNNEYHRDLNKGLHPELPCNYYEDNDPFNIPVLSWRNTSNTLYAKLAELLCIPDHRLHSDGG
mgnify:CR=1 FL=1